MSRCVGNIKHKMPSCNVVTALRRRSDGQRGYNSYCDPLHQHAEMCAATMCTDNHKAGLPARTRSTFMTAFTPDEKLVASCHGDHNIHVTDINTGKVVKTLVGHERSPWCIAFHPSSKDILATGCLNGEVRVWDLHSGGSESWICEMTESVTIQSLSFHPNDQVLLVATGNEIHFWDWSLEKPFKSVKTNSFLERVQLARFDTFGSRIMTGILNAEEDDVANADEDSPSVEQFDWRRSGEPPSAFIVSPSSSRSTVRLQNWLNNTPPVVTLTNRSTVTRPLTASYNLRGRHDSRSGGNGDNSAAAASSPASEPSNPESSGIGRLRRNRISELRQRMSDITHSHTYSRDHQRILHARVSVNAEIQHQYNRLQLLREERRRLEMRLDQLQNHPRAPRNQRLRGIEPSAADREFDTAWSSVRASLQSLERDAYEDYHEINDLIAARMRVRLLQSLDSDNVEVTVDFSNSSSNTEDPAPVEAPEAPLYPPPIQLITTPLIRVTPPVSRASTPSARIDDIPNIANPPTLPPTLPVEPILRRHRMSRSAGRWRQQDSPAPPTPPQSSSPFYFVDPALIGFLVVSVYEVGLTGEFSLCPLSPYFADLYGGPIGRSQEPDAPEMTQEPSPRGPTAFSRTRLNSRARRLRQRWRVRHRRHLNPQAHVPPHNLWADPVPVGAEKSTYRLQWWDFSKLQMPEISRNDLNVVVRECKIHNDSSVDISKSGDKVAALVWSEEEYPHLVQAGVFSLEKQSLGQLLYRKSFGPSQYAVCLSLSPLGSYLAVGLKHYAFLNEGFLAFRGATAEVLKLGKLGDLSNQYAVHKVHHPVTSDTPHRYASINTIAWLPGTGRGLLYGTNNGELRICFTKPPLSVGDEVVG